MVVMHNQKKARIQNFISGIATVESAMTMNMKLRITLQPIDG